MQRLRVLAYQTVARAVGFAGLGIFTLMTGLSYDPLLALRAGGVLVLIVLAVLLLKARAAPTADYRRTEMWLYLDPAERPPEAYAQWAAGTALGDAYAWFARWTAGVAALLWAAALLVSLVGPAPA